MTLLLRFASHSEIGLVRKNNQDSGYASPNLLVVADGMGGAAAGDLASAVAVEAIREVDAPTDAERMLPTLAGAIAEANTRIARLVEDDVSLEGMGTTVTGALFDGHELGLAHIGDSRAYLFRDDHLERLTHDHSWVQSLVDDGKINEADAAVHPHRSLLLKVLNGQPANEPDLTRLLIQEGDRLLFCSDGLCGLVEDADIAEALRIGELDRSLQRLVAEAHAGGGIDNITVILADVVDGPPVAPGDTTHAVVLGAAAERVLPSAALTGGGGPAGDDDDDLSDALPPRPVPGSSAHGDEARYNPLPPRKRRVLSLLTAAMVGLLAVAAALGAAYAWGRTQYYVGADGPQVAIYQGLPENIVVPLSRVYEVQPVTVADLPPYYQDQVHAGIEVSGLDSARQTVRELTEAVRRCDAQTPPPPAPSPRPTPPASPSATGSPATSPATTPAPGQPASTPATPGVETGC